MSKKVIFKHHSDFEIWPQCHPMLIEIIHWILHFVFAKKGITHVRITAVYYKGGSGVHEKLRATDLRFYKGDKEIDIVEYKGLESLINALFNYGDKRHNVVYVHDAGSGIHAHVQVRWTGTKKYVPITKTEV